MSKKLVLNKLFLYRYRFYIGFLVLGTLYVALLFGIPLLSPNGLSEAEMVSATNSYNLHLDSVLKGDVVDLPYRALQKISIMTFGFNAYAIKLPSIVIGLLLGAVLILLLNRWFKSNVALLASILAVLSSSFLYLAGSGTPLIMLVFWPTILLWLGSKIQGVTKPKPMYCFVFAFALLASIFTPHLIYLATFIVLFAFMHPHLRFTIKNLPVVPLVFTGLIVIAGLATLVIATVIRPEIIAELFLARDITLSEFVTNVENAFLPFFAWNIAIESIFLSPFIGLASVALAVIGLMSTTKGFFASRNSIASCLIIFTVFLSGLDPESAILILLPMAILIAHGLRYILDKWYDLFPNNPYARISAFFPIGIFLGIMIIGDISHFIFGYRYVPMVADEFQNDLALIEEHLEHGTTIYAINDDTAYQFYKIYEDLGYFTIKDQFDPNDRGDFATLGLQHNAPGTINDIITSPKSDNSDRIYIYTRTNETDYETITEGE